MVHPNLDFLQEIRSSGDFHKIATIPCTATDGFEQVDPDTANFAKIEKCERLREIPLSHYRINATSMLAHNDTLLVGTDSMTLPHPFPLEAMGSTRHTPDSTTYRPITIEVFTHIGGEIRRISSQGQVTTTLAEAIPRYLFYPDRRAFLMTISDTETTYALSLEPHEKLQGAFWTGGTGTDYLPANVTEVSLPQTGSESESADTNSILLISNKGNILAFNSDNNCKFTQSSITSLYDASKPPKSGRFGRHNLYAFATDGIWMLEYSEGNVKSTHRISTLQCNRNVATAYTGDGVYFVSAGQLYHISGSEIEEVSDAVVSLSTKLRQLPHWKQLLTTVGMTCEEGTTEDYFGDCGLLYSHKSNAIIAFRPDRAFSFVYFPGNKSWMTSDSIFTGKINTPAGCLGISTCRNKASNIFGTELVNGTADTFLITRPIKLGSTLSPHCIRNIEILGYFECGNVQFSAYGTNDLRQWHLIGSSDCHHLKNFNTTGYRMIRVCVAARLSEGEYLYGVRISSDD